MTGTGPENLPKCSPLCGATKAYGNNAEKWQHEPNCPVRLENLPKCICPGCWACPGHEPGCTCDVDWDALTEARLNG